MTEVPGRNGASLDGAGLLAAGTVAGVAQPPLSFAQEQLWFIDEFHNGLAAHNVASLVWLRGPLDMAALDRAVAGLVARHEVLRTRLIAGPSGRPVLQTDPPGPAGPTGTGRLERAELPDSPADPAARRLAVREYATAQALHPFHLGSDWPFRAILAPLAAAEHALLLLTHRTAADDWSLGLLAADLAALYRAEITGQPAGLAEPARFADYAGWQRQRLAGGRAGGGPPDDELLAGLRDYWREALAGLQTSQFPTDRPRPVLASHDGAVQRLAVADGLLHGLRELSRHEGTTVPVTLLASVQVLLSRYTGQEDVVTGLLGADPGRPELAELSGLTGLPATVGLVADMLPVRCDLSGDPSFTELLARARKAAEAEFARRDLPFALIVEALQLERDPGRFPVFQVGLSYAEPSGLAETGGLTFVSERLPVPASMLDISLVAEPRADGSLWLEATYPPALFDRDTVSRLLGHWAELLAGIVADPLSRLSRLPVLTAAELHRELVEWNDTAASFPVRCIHQGFEAQVAQTPNAVAAQFEAAQFEAAQAEDDSLCYAELNRRANQIARRLRERGVGPEVLVGVCMQTGLARLAGLLGIWKAGGGYVPLDPALPPGRLSFMIADTGMSVILADAASAPSVPAAAGVRVLILDAEQDQIAALDGSNLAGTGVSPSNVAYVIYTSGSTGEPKGVVVEHRQAINFLQGMAGPWHIGPGAAVLAFAAFTFDVSVCDMFLPLLAGGKVVLAAPETLHSPPRLAELIRSARITFACLPPAVLNLLTGEEFPELRTLLSAGEELSSELLRSWLRDDLEIFNGYGPTEASIGSTYMRLDASAQLPPPIGRPKPNYQVYVLDRHGNPVPVGVVGELHVGGAGVARGYLNRPELTRERFIGDPFRDVPGARLYKTGDLVRRRADGTIVFAGRADDQVKIRGLRVELGEIESTLLAHPAVAQAVVSVITDPAGQQQLAAYLRPVPADGAGPEPELDLAGLRADLAGALPGYMIPSYLTVLAEFPLTPNGKINKAALPAPEAAAGTAERVRPATVIETVLVDMYAAVLGHERAGATDSFFDAGGNSLQAMQLITELRAALAADLDVSAVFLAPTPRQLAAVLRDGCGFDDAEIGPDELQALDEPGSRPKALAGRDASRGRPSAANEIPRRPAGLTDLPLSYGQEQLWFIDQLTPGQPTYNIPLALALSGPLDSTALERAVGDLVARHEALRTRLVARRGGAPVQVIDPPAMLPPARPDLSGLAPDRRQAALRELIDTEALRPFGLATGPLLRTWLIRLAAAEHVLLIVVHHAVFDGWSAGVLLHDLAALYQGRVTGEPSGLTELPVQFADYALWQRRRLRGALLAGREDYWRSVLTGLPVVQFPLDRPRPVLQSFDGALAVRLAGRELLDALRQLARRQGSTPFVILMASLHALLSRYTGQTDLVVGTVSASRLQAELVPLIGFLVNTLPVRAEASGDPAFTELIRRVQQATTGAFAHQDLPFGKLVEALGMDRDPSRSPVFQIALSYAERDAAGVRAADVDFALTDLVVGINAAKFDLDLLAEARPEGLWFECSYATALFDPGTIERLLQHWEVLLRGAVADPSARLSRLPVLTAAELHRELTEWNDTAVGFPLPCLHQGVAAQAAGRPDAVAAQFEREHLSYAELSRRASRLARRLRGLGAGPEILVGVCLPAGLRRLAGVLGILQAGAGYVPLDPGLPGHRLSFLLGDTSMPILLADDSTLPVLPPAAAVTVLNLESGLTMRSGPNPDGPSSGGHSPGGQAVPANVAYVIYTSGSTGRPKGVVVEHRQAVSVVQAMNYGWGAGPASVLLQFSSFSFDVSVTDMFMPLLCGGRLVLAATETLHTPSRLAALVRQAGVGYLDLPVSVLSLLSPEQLCPQPLGPGQPPGLKVLMTGGEELPAELARRWLRPGLRLVNGYGPTEATVTSTCQELGPAAPGSAMPGTPWSGTAWTGTAWTGTAWTGTAWTGTAWTGTAMGPPPVGLPIPNYRGYVLDRRLNPVPAGVVGELYLGGAGVTRGYLGRPGPTGARFIADPFGPQPGARLYRTGDLVRRRADGAIVFVGRTDDQVKIRGLRVEPGEIEAALTAHPAVAQAVVAVVTDPAGDRQLAGYVRLAPDLAAGAGPDLAGLRRHLARLLPGYLVPPYLQIVTGFTLNASGKIDRAALPSPESPSPESPSAQSPSAQSPSARAPSAQSSPARAPLAGGTGPVTGESDLAALFGRVLGRGQVGPDDSFFAVGGSSLQVMRLVELISRELGTDIGISTIFLHPSPRQLAGWIEAGQRTTGQLTTGQLTTGQAGLADGSGPLLELSSGVGELPVFWMHPVGGTVFGYARLAAELAGSFRSYGIQAPGLNSDGGTAASLTRLVADYTERIQAVQPAGPYRLGGWSIGGVIAFEVARRLERAGDQVSMLALLDAPFRFSGQEELPGQPELAGQFLTDAALSVGLDPAELPDPAAVSAAAQLAWLAGQLGMDDAQLRRRFEVFRAHVRMLAGYSPPGCTRPVRAPALIVSADRSANARFLDEWRQVLGGPVSAVRVDSDHYQLLRDPLVADLGASILKWHDGGEPGAAG